VWSLVEDFEAEGQLIPDVLEVLPCFYGCIVKVLGNGRGRGLGRFHGDRSICFRFQLQTKYREQRASCQTGNETLTVGLRWLRAQMRLLGVPCKSASDQNAVVVLHNLNSLEVIFTLVVGLVERLGRRGGGEANSDELSKLSCVFYHKFVGVFSRS